MALVAEQEMLMFLHVYQMHSGRRGQEFCKTITLYLIIYEGLHEADFWAVKYLKLFLNAYYL